MSFVPLKVTGACIATDETLIRNMEHAIAQGLPEVMRQEPAREGVIAVVASGPSVKSQLKLIKEMQAGGTPIVAVKDAHDWLIGEGVIPEFALAIDPQAHRWNCFKRKRSDVHYMIASQCDAAVFEYLEGAQVTIWHPYVMKGQKRPVNRMLIGGGTTSGLRAISLFYVLGYRHFALFGFDSCLDNGVLRVNGDIPKPSEAVSEVRIDKDGESFYCTPGMALQAEHFQTYYEWIPDAQFYGFGKGLIQAIIQKHEDNAQELQRLHEMPKVANNRVSFIHYGGETTASFRYRARNPADWIGASVNDLTADVLVFAKPEPEELMLMARAKARGAWVIVDFCDDHFDWVHYADALRLADAVICPTAGMAAKIKELGKDAMVVPDGYESAEFAPHCNGTNLLWFGHGVNKKSLERIMPDLEPYPLRVVSNFGGTIPWSPQTMDIEFARADIVVLPATDEKKSNNRTLEAIRRGCFVVAEPHPAINHIPGIWLGNIKEGIEWARQNRQEANQRTGTAQRFVAGAFSRQTLAPVWKIAMARPTTSDAEKRSGTVG